MWVWPGVVGPVVFGLGNGGECFVDEVALLGGEGAPEYPFGGPDRGKEQFSAVDDVGVVGVALFRRKPADQPVSIAPPAAPESRPQPFNGPAAKSEAPARADNSAPASAAGSLLSRQAEEKIGTGHGRIEDSRVTYTSFERATSTPSEVIAIYYDSYRNLLARGVIRERSAPAAPQPFPGFVPDPKPYP